MNTYEKKQIFKERLFKHILDLDYESLEDLLAEGNPYGHLNMRYILPININIYKKKHTSTKKEDGEYEWFHGSNTLIYCHNKTPLDIVWKWWVRLFAVRRDNDAPDMDEDEFILPNGLLWGDMDDRFVDLDEMLYNILIILYKEYYKCNINNNKALLKLFFPMRYRKIKMYNYNQDCEVGPSTKTPLIRTKISFIIWAFSDWPENSYRVKNLEYFKENILNYPKDTPWNKEHYTMMLICHPNLFNEFVDKYSLTKKMATFLLKELIKSLTDKCDNKDVDIWENLLKYGANEEEPNIYPETPFMKKMWKLRCVRLDPVRWPSIEDFDDNSAEELREMYYGNPMLLRLEIDE